MEITLEYKNEVERKIVEIVMQALERGMLQQQDLPPIGEFVLDRIDKIKNHQELFQFLDDLSHKWSIFDPLLTLEKGRVKDAKEDEVFRNVLTMAKSGKVEEAISLAKTMTQT